MATPTFDNQQPWVPFEATKDCSQGFCSVYCPQWCYVIFPPPPPQIIFPGDSPSDGAATLSPLTIAVIALLAAAFVLVSYYFIFSRYFCRRRRTSRNAAENEPGPQHQQQQRHAETTWQHVPPSIGLDEALIDKIAVYKYEARGGVISGTDCSVCLSEFREGESLRLLPKCSHAFHLQCIDVWLKSHSSCPICRANIMSVSSPARDRPLLLPSPPLEPESDRPIEDDGRGDETVIVVVQEGGGEIDLGNGCDSDQLRDDRGSQPMRRSFSMGSSTCYGGLSIADVLRMSMEDEPSRHCVKYPVMMKRSNSSGNLCFKEQNLSPSH